MEFPEVPEDLSGLSDDELATLHDELVAAFNEATAEGASVDDATVAALSGVADSIDRLRSEQGTREEAATARSEQLAALADRVNASTSEVDGEGDPEGEGSTDDSGDGDQEGSSDDTEDGETGQEGGAATAPGDAPPSGQASNASVTAGASNSGASLAALQRRAPARTRPRPADPATMFPSVTAAADLAGVAAGASVKTSRQIAEMMAERRRTLGEGNGDRATVATFHRDLPESHKLNGLRDPEAFAEALAQFDQTAQGIQAAGGLCAPLTPFYDQYTLAQAMRPVRDSLPNFNADRGGIRIMPPPTRSTVTKAAAGLERITAAQDLAGSTKGTQRFTCPSAEDVVVYAIYMQLTFGNMPTRTWPERMEAINKTAIAEQASLAEQYLLDGIAAKSTSVTTQGLVGAGRELFVRAGQAAAGYRSRHRLPREFPLQIMLPAWSLDLVQADFGRAFSDDTGFISLSADEARSLFGVRNLIPTFYVDSKTGGGQVFGPGDSGRSVTDGVTATNTALTSATAAFTAADVGKPVSGSGIASGTTIASVTNGTTVVLSAATTATASGVTVRIGAHILANFPTSVYGYLFSAGSFLHLDAGTLDLGLVRDSTLNSTNEFSTFTESFENVAFVGQESLEIVFNLSPNGSASASRAITDPILN